MEFNTPHLSITLIIIILTAILSIAGFSNQKVIDDLIFYPPAVSRRKQWYRFITCGFIHADVIHLVFNMYAFYMFGGAVEVYFEQLFNDNGKWLYVVLYVSSLVVCLLPTYLKNQDNYYYKSLGASGAVAAVVFAFIFLAPMVPLGLIILPGVRIPAFIFGVLYLAISAYLDKRGGGSINHSAHFWGAVYGIVFLLVTCFFLADYPVGQKFLEQVQAWISGL
ncbi:MAG: rhomboid family intrarane serine protease [Chitinophagaceae bacterium]|nr:rhomboid family intrarane serine protease [Chitinophagaceae bacterium]